MTVESNTSVHMDDIASQYKKYLDTRLREGHSVTEFAIWRAPEGYTILEYLEGRPPEEGGIWEGRVRLRAGPETTHVWTIFKEANVPTLQSVREAQADLVVDYARKNISISTNMMVAGFPDDAELVKRIPPYAQRHVL